jgi:hypothetical protein
LIVTLRFSLVPAMMLSRMGESEIVNGGGPTVTLAVAEPPPKATGSVALIVADPGATPVTWNETVRCPAGIVAVFGTVAMEVLEELSASVVLLSSA